MSSSWTASCVLYSGKWLQNHTKCLKVFSEMKFYYICVSLNGLKYSERDFRPWRWPKEWAACNFLIFRNIYKSLWTGVQRLKWPWNWCRINSPLTGIWFMRFFIQVWERGSCVSSSFHIVKQFSKRSTESQHVKTSYRSVWTIHTFPVSSSVEKSLV